MAKEKAKKYLGSDYIISGIVRDGVPHIQLLPPIPQHTHTSRLSLLLGVVVEGCKTPRLLFILWFTLGSGVEL